MSKITRFEDLRCWQAARMLVREIYTMLIKEIYQRTTILKVNLKSGIIFNEQHC